MNLIDVLKPYDDSIWDKRIGLVRHKDPRWDLEKIARSGHFEVYQSNQAAKIFDPYEYLISFIGEEGSRSRFVGVFRVLKVSKATMVWPEGFPYPEMPMAEFTYELQRQAAFDVLCDRLIVDWGRGTRSWVQKLRPREVIEIRPKGWVGEFPGYDNVVITFDQLERIIRNPDANRSWHNTLGSVAGVYLILDDATGQQYVGSASGEAGLLGRWRGYVDSKHGGNKLLMKLLAEDPNRYRRFVFSIFRALPRSLAAKDALDQERLYKHKLGSRAFGLNDN